MYGSCAASGINLMIWLLIKYFTLLSFLFLWSDELKVNVFKNWSYYVYYYMNCIEKIKNHIICINWTVKLLISYGTVFSPRHPQRTGILKIFRMAGLVCDISIYSLYFPGKSYKTLFIDQDPFYKTNIFVMDHFEAWFGS